MIAYIHIPKTGGATVSKTLFNCTPYGRAAIHYLHFAGDFPLHSALTWAWVTRHVPRDDLAKQLIWLGRPIDYFSMVQAIAQLVSHFNYSFHLIKRDDYLKQRDDTEQRVDMDVLSTDFSNPFAIANLLLRHADRYLNIQSRYILGCDFAQISECEATRRLTTYKYIGTDDEFPKLFRSFAFVQLPEGVE